ncbi:monooxygenase [Mycobacterium lehmannii]|uniref:Monooxygenase n=1 Tax=Mycobacterium lehmannii TaxID=2048550 RepID=A0A101A0V2_9MYCO|nr:monooxygenase [Mycobacterium lehmannii]
MAAQRVFAAVTELYDGVAAVRMHDTDHDVRVRLTGHLDPIDGRYHWRGTVFDLPSDMRLPQAVRISIHDRTAEGQLTEVTPWGTHSVTGVGTPPYPLNG